MYSSVNLIKSFLICTLKVHKFLYKRCLFFCIHAYKFCNPQLVSPHITPVLSFLSNVASKTCLYSFPQFTTDVYGYLVEQSSLLCPRVKPHQLLSIHYLVPSLRLSFLFNILSSLVTLHILVEHFFFRNIGLSSILLTHIAFP